MCKGNAVDSDRMLVIIVLRRSFSREYACTRTYVNVQAKSDMCARTNKQAHAHARTRTHAHARAHTHAPRQTSLSSSPAYESTLFLQYFIELRTSNPALQSISTNIAFWLNNLPPKSHLRTKASFKKCTSNSSIHMVTYGGGFYKDFLFLFVQSILSQLQFVLWLQLQMKRLVFGDSRLSYYASTSVRPQREFSRQIYWTYPNSNMRFQFIGSSYHGLCHIFRDIVIGTESFCMFCL